MKIFMSRHHLELFMSDCFPLRLLKGGSDMHISSTRSRQQSKRHRLDTIIRDVRRWKQDVCAIDRIQATERTKA